MNITYYVILFVCFRFLRRKSIIMDDASNNVVIKRASDISNICLDHEDNVPIKKEMKQETKGQFHYPTLKVCAQTLYVTTLQ